MIDPHAVRRSSPPGATGRRRLLSGIGAGLAFCALPGRSQVMPSGSRPMRLVVSFPPGGTADMLARSLSEGVSRATGQTVVVENRPGANGNIAADLVAKSPADGGTLLVTAPGPLVVNGALYSSLPFDPETAFVPVTRLAIAPLLLVVPASLGVKTLPELMRYLKAHPDKATFASQGNASSGHLAMELLKSRTGLEATHVPYKGSAPALNDLLAGHVTMMFDNTTSSLPHVRSGALRAIAVAEPRRIPAAPDVPTVAESGVPGFEATPWFAVVAPAGTPAATVDRLNTLVRDAMHAPAVQARFEPLGVSIVGDTPAAFARYIAAESRKWREVVRVSGARAD